MVFLCIATILLTSTSVLVMAEEFEQLPKSLQEISSTLVHNRKSRTAFICGVIILMSLASSLSIVMNQDQESYSDMNKNETEALVDGNNTLSISSRELVVNVSLTTTVRRNISIRSRFKRYVNETFVEDYNVQISGSAKLEVSSNDSVESELQYEGLPAWTSMITENYHDCPHPEYIVFTWVLCLIALAAALKLYYLIKLFLALVMVAVYTSLILLPYNIVFSDTYIKSKWVFLFNAHSQWTLA